VLARDPGDLVKWIENPEFATQVRRSIRTTKVGRSDSGEKFILEFFILPLPVNVAFDVIARADGKEFAIGRLAAPKQSFLECAFGSFELTHASFEHLDLVFRASQAAARNTVDLFEILDGRDRSEGRKIHADVGAVTLLASHESASLIR